jgi:hypothetical protein
MLKQQFLIWFVLGIPFFGFSQNLVRNGGFEQYSNCNGSIYNTIYWYDPTFGTPDFFNVCVTDLSSTSVPANYGGLGYQYPSSGDGFIGILLFSAAGLEREYIQQQFVPGLQAGKLYCISSYINLANWNQYCIDALAITLSVNSISCSPTPCSINFSPQIIFPSGNCISDTLNWTPLAGIYLASGGEQYITIGNFYADASTNAVQVYPTNFYPSAYYYVDDVSITLCRPPVLGNDTLIVIGESIVVGDTAQDVADYFWSPSIGLNCDTCWQTIASPVVPTTYTLTKITPCDTTTESIFIDVTVGEFEYYNSFSYQVYPNPNAGTFTLVHPVFDVPVRLEVYDLSGRRIYLQYLSQGTTSSFTDISMENGIYFYRIVKAEEIITSGKLEIVR